MTNQFDQSDFSEEVFKVIPGEVSKPTLTILRRAIVRLAKKHRLAGDGRMAKSVAYTVVNSVWRSIAALIQTNRRIRPLFAALDIAPLPCDLIALIHEFAHHASKSPSILTTFEVGQIYSSLLPDHDRKSGGIHYTPPHIAHEMVLQARRYHANFATGRILEPSAGGGILLLAALGELLAANNKAEIELLADLPTRLIGLEIDPFAAWLAQVAVDIRLLPISLGKNIALPRVVRTADTLQVDLEEDLDLVLMNPPYGRQKLTADQREKFTRVLYGHANAYGLFLDQALRATKRNGIVVALTPTSFLSGEYYKNLRVTLGGEANLRQIGFFETRVGVFDGVQQELAVTTIQNSKSSEPTLASRIHFNANGDLSREIPGAFDLPQCLSAPWILPRDRTQISAAQNAPSMTYRLTNWGYKVKTGPIIWNRFGSKISGSHRQDSVPLIFAGCLQKDGEFSWPCDARKDKVWLNIGSDQTHLLQSKPCALLQRTTSKEQSRRLVATALPLSLIDEFGAVAVENHVQILEPKTETPTVPLETLVAFLNCSTVDTLFRCISGSASVSAFELNALPIPSAAHLAYLNDLVAHRAPSSEINREIQRLYQQ